jgi:hypothetical protein
MPLQRSYVFLRPEAKFQTWDLRFCKDWFSTERLLSRYQGRPFSWSVLESREGGYGEEGSRGEEKGRRKVLSAVGVYWSAFEEICVQDECHALVVEVLINNTLNRSKK